MRRTLHVIDQPGQAAEAAVLRLSVDAAKQQAQSEADQHAWLLLGGEPTCDTARAIGLRDEQFCLMPKPVGMHRYLPHALAAPKRLMAQAHRVCCWTEGAAQVASLLGIAHAVRRVDDATLSPFAQRTITRAYAERGAAQTSGRKVSRERWGVDDDTIVIALLGDRYEQVDASAALMTVVLTHEALCASVPERSAVRLLCHPLAKRRADAAVFGELLSLDQLLIQDAAVAQPWAVLAGCDVALAPVPSEAGLSILWADAMGLPVVSPDDDRLPLLSQLPHVVVSRSAEPKVLADALTNWAHAHTPQAIHV